MNVNVGVLPDCLYFQRQSIRLPVLNRPAVRRGSPSSSRTRLGARQYGGTAGKSPRIPAQTTQQHKHILIVIIIKYTH